MAIEIIVNGTRAILSNGVWHSRDRVLAETLTVRATAYRPEPGTYEPDPDLALIADLRTQGLTVEIVREERPPPEPAEEVVY